MKANYLFCAALAVFTSGASAQTYCTFTQGFYGLASTKGCYNNSTIQTSKQIMLNAFGASTFQFNHPTVSVL